MRHSLLAFCFLPFLAVAAQPIHFALSESGAQTIGADHAADLLKQCSRSAPEPSGPFWAPTSSQIAELERGLVPLMATRSAEKQRVPPSGLYGRQYIGYTHAGINYIYGSFFPVEPTWRPSPNAEPSVICDGGSSFWGIVYRVDSKSFEEPQFNGVA